MQLKRVFVCATEESVCVCNCLFVCATEESVCVCN